jgi:hypothetical protein
MPTINLPMAYRRLEPYRTRPPRRFPSTAGIRFNRIALAATHVVADPLADSDPWLAAALDWDATIAYRRYLWRMGLGVAEAMDTAQRGMGLDWPTSLELIRHSVAAAREVDGALLFCGAGTDHLAPGPHDLAAVVAAYDKQMAAIDGCGGRIILMASGMFTSFDRAGLARALDDNRRAVDEAAALGASCLVLVVGGLAPGSRDLPAARAIVRDGLGELLPHARAARMPLAIERAAPSHVRCRPRLHQHARSGERSLRGARSGSRRGRRCLPRLVGSGARHRDRPGRPRWTAARLPCLRLAHADQRPTA